MNKSLFHAFLVKASLAGVSSLSLFAGAVSCSGEGNESSLPPEFANQYQGSGASTNTNPSNPASDDGSTMEQGLGQQADGSNAQDSLGNDTQQAGDDGQVRVRTEGLGDPDAPANTTDGQTNSQVVLPNASSFGDAQMTGSGESADRYRKADVTRDGRNYLFMANGWGPGFQSQAVSWSGSSFTVDSMQGSQGDNYEPASYPTMFCGQYSDSVSGDCGLPRELSALNSLRTGWSWRANGNTGQYNAAYDVWLGTGPSINDFSGFLMVWYREPVGQQPAGRFRTGNVTVANVPGVWDIWEGEVTVGGQNHPIINWVRSEGQDTEEMEFDIMDFVRDAPNHGYTVPGTHVLSVAVGFEIWNGPINDLKSLDFYVDPQ